MDLNGPGILLTFLGFPWEGRYPVVAPPRARSRSSPRTRVFWLGPKSQQLMSETVRR